MCGACHGEDGNSKMEKIPSIAGQPEFFLVHQLSHLSDRVHHVEKAGATGTEFLAGERRAFELEMMAANLVSRGALARKLDELLEAWHPHSLDEVVELGLKMGEHDLHALDETILAGISQSEHEAGMRNGFFLAALVIREGQRSAAAPDTVLQAIDLLMQHNQP